MPVHFINQDVSPGLKKGGTLNIVRHVIEMRVPADAIPESITVDLSKVDMAESVHISAVTLPEGCRPTITDRDFTVATIVPPIAAVEAAPARRRQPLLQRPLLRLVLRRQRLPRAAKPRPERRRQRPPRQQPRRRPQPRSRRNKPNSGRSSPIEDDLPLHPRAEQEKRRTLPCPSLRGDFSRFSPMKLFVGLGNPGRLHAGNRHNIGFMAVDAIAQQHKFPPFRKRFQGQVSEASLAGVKVIVLKPETYMNEFGPLGPRGGAFL